MIRTSSVLIAFLLIAVATPARAQHSAASMPLPALLQPDAGTGAHPGIRAGRAPDLLEATATGMAVGCLVFGISFAATGDNAFDGRLTSGLIGCGFGVVVGGTFSFVFAGMKQVLRPRG